MKLSECIVNYRKDNGLSQRQFAIKCGLSNGYISMLEKEINPKTNEPITPSLPALKQISDGMGITIDELFSVCEDMPVDISAPSLTLDEQLDGIEFALLGEVKELTDAQKRDVLQFVKFLKEKRG